MSVCFVDHNLQVCRKKFHPKHSIIADIYERHSESPLNGDH